MCTKLFRSLSVGILTVLLLAGTGVAATYQIDPAHSSAEFSIRHIFSQVTGRFTNLSGAIMYDPEQVAKSTVQATIQIASINTNNERRDGHLQSPDFFDVAKYTEITFKSTKVEKKGDKLMVTGNLTMHGITKSVVLPVEVLGVGTHPMSKKPVAGFAAELTLNRSDFGVDNWVGDTGILGKDVKIALNIEAAGGGGMANPCNPCNPCGKTMGKNPCNPCGKTMANPCNPCGKAMEKNPCNPCEKAHAKNPCNPCGKAKAKNPCNPCGKAKAKNPCNPCGK